MADGIALPDVCQELIAQPFALTGTGDQPGHVDELDRRAGDPPMLIGDPQSIAVDLGWKANYGVTEILQSAWDAWQAGPRAIEVPSQS